MNFENNQYSQNPDHYLDYNANSQIDIQKHSNCIQAQDIEELYLSKDKLRSFVEQIGSQKYTPLRDDVLDHCDKIKAMKNESLNYDKLEKMVRNRIQKMIKNKRIKKNWSEQDILILIWVISKYADFKKIRHIQRDLTEKDWGSISQLIPGVDGENCMFKWLSLKKNKLSDYGWSEKQSSILNKLVRQKININIKYQQPDWSLISQQLYYLNNSSNKVYRCPKQCRQHWNCYLNPHLKKGPWCQQQDLILLSEIKSKNGLKKWADMVKLFNGRTQNALKNRFNLIIQKQKHSQSKNKHLSELELVNSYLQKNYISQFVSEKQIYSQSQIAKKIEDDSKKDSPYKQVKIQSKESIQCQPKRVLRNRVKSHKCIEHIPEKQYDSLLCQKFEPFVTTPIKVIGTKMENQAWEFNPIQLTPVITISQFQNKYDAENLHTPQGIPLNFTQPIKIQNIEKMYQQEQIKFMNLTPRSKDSVILPDLQKIKIVPVKQHDMLKIKQLLLGLSKGQIKQCSFVPCQISQNKLTKFNC